MAKKQKVEKPPEPEGAEDAPITPKPARERKGLRVLTPAGTPPVPLPKGVNDERPPDDALWAWAEACRDEYESQGKCLTVTGLLFYVNYHADAGWSYEGSQALKLFYFNEICSEWAVLVAGERTLSREPVPRTIKATEAEGGEDDSPKGEVTQKALRTPGTITRSRETWAGHPATAVVRWMGANGWTLEETKAAVQKAGVGIADNTVSIQHRAGVKRDARRGPIPDFTPEQVKEVEALK